MAEQEEADSTDSADDWRSAAFLPPPHDLQVPAHRPFDTATAPTRIDYDDSEDILEENVERIAELQRKLHADDRFALLLVFQAMDAAGKDGTIRRVMSGVNPAGCQVFTFKTPSAEELQHDFLWRSAKRLPERGRIGVFNRSYYEEVLVVRVHPEFLGNQQLPGLDPGSVPDSLWSDRLRSIRDHEAHLARNGTVILKFWLNVSLEEQAERFLDRLDEPDKHWKFHARDLDERALWDRYMHAYSEMLPATSRPWSPWYAIPADSKKDMRAIVSGIVADTLEALPLRWPEVPDEEKRHYPRYRRELGAD